MGKLLHTRSVLRHPKAVWIGVLILSPLAYVGAMKLENSIPGQTNISVLSREAAIRAARDFAAARQIPAETWPSDIGVKNHKDLRTVSRSVPMPELARVAPDTEIDVLLQSPDGKRWIRVQLTPDGYPVGFQENQPLEVTPAAASEARELAISFVRGQLGPGSPLVLEQEKVSSSDSKPEDRTYTWRAPVPSARAVRLNFRVEVFGNRVIFSHTTTTVGDDYLARLRPYRNWLKIMNGVGGFYVFLLGVYAFVRYIQRMQDKEVSHWRTALVMLVFAIPCALMMVDPGYLASSNNGDPMLGSLRLQQLVYITMGMLFLGMFLGIAYGAGEGAMRETYPGKLTSLDSLLSGKIFSSNVARSILAGGGFAGWLLLVQNAAVLATHQGRPGTEQAILGSAFMSFPAADLFWEAFAYEGLMMTTFGLLLPIALLRPRIKREWLFLTMLPVFSILSAASTVSDQTAWGAFAISEVALVAAICLPFLFGDLLSAATCVVALTFASALLQRGAVSPVWQHMILWIVAPVGVAFLAVEAYLARWGRTYGEKEVWPMYARRISEYRTLQAEIGAARQAQVRLLPDAPPRMAGLSIAGSCVPAREVGGDFFDFYEVDDHRLGVFLAEGGNRELGSAMTIALAKGFLLFTSRTDSNPVEILRRLEQALGAAQAESGPLAVLYAVIDTRAGSLHYARAGVSPRVAINGVDPAEEISGGAEGAVIRHGVARLQPKDALFFYTDGFATQIAWETRRTPGSFLAGIARRMRSGSAADLHEAMLKAALKRKKVPPPDDVTTVVIRIEEPVDRAMEVVA